MIVTRRVSESFKLQFQEQNPRQQASMHDRDTNNLDTQRILRSSHQRSCVLVWPDVMRGYLDTLLFFFTIYLSCISISQASRLL